MYQATKAKVHVLLHPEIGDTRWDKIINLSIIILIILNVIAVMLETVQSIHDRYEEFFYYFDLISVIIFTIEYVLRVWSCNHEAKYKHSIGGRIRYMLSFGALIDLLAILPFYLHAIVGFDLRMLRILRLMRFFRLFRLTSYMKATKLVTNVFKSRINELLLSLVLTIFLIIIASCLLYFAEHNLHTKGFESIPDSIWWAVVTLTTTGYGDVVPVTPIGKILTGIVLIMGIALIALPAGIITTGFLDEMRKMRVRTEKKCPHCGMPIDDDHDHNDE